MYRRRPRNQGRVRNKGGIICCSFCNVSSEKTSSVRSYRDNGQFLRRRADVERFLGRLSGLQVKPIEGVRPQRELIGRFSNGRKFRPPKYLNRHRPLERSQVELHRLRKARKIGYDQHAFVVKLSDERHYFAIAGIKKFQAAPSESAELLALLDQALHPPQQGMRIVVLGFDVDGFVVILGIDIHRQVQALRIGPGEPGIAIRTPLHGRANPVAIAQENVVAHADLVAVVDNRRARQREQQGIHQLDLAGDRFPAAAPGAGGCQD